jgi:hypothetical protein
MQNVDSNSFSILGDEELLKKASCMRIMVDSLDFASFDTVKDLERARMALQKKLMR